MLVALRCYAAVMTVHVQSPQPVCGGGRVSMWCTCERHGQPACMLTWCAVSMAFNCNCNYSSKARSKPQADTLHSTCWCHGPATAARSPNSQLQQDYCSMQAALRYATTTKLPCEDPCVYGHAYALTTATDACLSQDVTSSAYAQDIVFEDPISRFTDLSGYQFMIRVLKTLFSVTFDLHEVTVTAPDTVTTRCAATATVCADLSLSYRQPFCQEHPYLQMTMAADVGDWDSLDLAAAPVAMLCALCVTDLARHC